MIDDKWWVELCNAACQQPKVVHFVEEKLIRALICLVTLDVVHFNAGRIVWEGMW